MNAELMDHLAMGTGIALLACASCPDVEEEAGVRPPSTQELQLAARM